MTLFIRSIGVYMLMLTLVGCTDNCIDLDGPVFQTDRLPHATLNEEYDADIKVQLRNEPFDDSYYYDFDVDSDDLPKGLRYYQLDDGRVLTIEGTPTEFGTFKLDVLVTVEGNFNLCYRRARANYTLVVDEI